MKFKFDFDPIHNFIKYHFISDFINDRVTYYFFPLFTHLKKLGIISMSLALLKKNHMCTKVCKIILE